MSNELKSSLVQNCFGRIQNYTIQLFNSKGSVLPMATGVLVKTNKDHFIFTVAHVLEDFENENLLYLRQGKNEFLSLRGEIFYSTINSTYNIDIGYIKLEEKYVPLIKKTNHFLDSTNIGLNFELGNKEFVVASGFPVINSTVDDSGISSVGTIQDLQHSADKVYKYYNYSKEDHYIVDYKYRDPKTNKLTKLESPYGNSGGGLWTIRDTITPLGTFPQPYLIGLLSTVKNAKYYVLIAERLENLISEVVKRNDGNFNITNLKT